MSAALIAAALASLTPQLGAQLGPSSWLTVDQPMIDAFAALTEDRQFIHIDPVAARATPLGTTIAHGFLTLSLLSRMAHGLLPPVPGRVMGINYGFERIRFVTPVRCGARLRGRFTVKSVEARPPDGVMLRLDATVEIAGEARPALSAEWLTLSLLGP